MTDHDRLRALLEAQAPRLSDAAAARLDRAVAAALTGRRSPHRLWRPVLILAPAAAVLAIFLWMGVRNPEINVPSYTMLNESELVTALESYGGDLDQITGDGGEVLFDEEDWNEADWRTFQSILEDFDPRAQGGSS